MRIAIVKLSALGDIIHAMIILQFIKEFNSKISIDWIVEENYKELFNFHPHINEVHSVNFKKAQRKKSIIMAFHELKKLKKLDSYDLVIDLQGLVKSAVISRLIPSKLTIGFDRLSVRESIASFFYNKTFNYRYGENIIKRNIAIIEFALGFRVSKKQIERKLSYLYPTDNPSYPWLSTSKKNILIIPGASFKSKRYPIEKFAELIKILEGNFLILWGSDEEKYLADSLKKLVPNVNVCGKLSLASLVSLVAKVDLIIGPDTGPTHLGWALNVPSIALFGSTPGKRNAFVTKINRIIESKSEVNPFKIDKDDNSIKEISPDEILKVSKEISKT